MANDVAATQAVLDFASGVMNEPAFAQWLAEHSQQA